MVIQFTIVVNGGCYCMSEARKKFKTLRKIDFLDKSYIKVFAEDIAEAHQIKNALTEKDFEYQSNETIHRRKIKHSYKTYWDTESIFIFVERGDNINTV